MTGQLPKQAIKEALVSETSKVVKEEPQDEEPTTLRNDLMNPRPEKGVKRRSVQYMDYLPPGYMPYPVYGAPPSKTSRSSQGSSHMMHPMGYPMPHGMPPHPHAYFPFIPGFPVPGSSSSGYMHHDMMSAQMMQHPYRIPPHEAPTPGAKYVLVDPTTGKQEVYMLVKVEEIQGPIAEKRKKQRKSSSRVSVASSVVETTPIDVPAQLSRPTTNQQRLINPFSFSSLITLAIINSSGRKATLSAIYDFILEHFRGFSEAGVHWRNSIRHSLSYALFAEVRNDETDGASAEHEVEWTVAEGRFGRLMEDIRRVVETNRHEPDNFLMYNIDNLVDMVCGDLGSRRSQTAAHSIQHILSSSSVKTQEDRASTENSASNSPPPVPAHRKSSQVFRLEDDEKIEHVVIEDVDK